jgi:hypothetical protein
MSMMGMMGMKDTTFLSQWADSDSPVSEAAQTKAPANVGGVRSVGLVLVNELLRTDAEAWMLEQV